MRRSLVHRVVLGCSMAGTALLGPVTVAHGQDLKDAVPPDVYMYVYAEPGAMSGTLQGYYQEITDAILDARFDLLALDVLKAALPPEDSQMVSQLHGHISQLVSDVPWDQISAGNFLFARSMRMDPGQPAPSDTILLGWELPEGSSAGVHQSMRDLLAGLVGLSGELQLTATHGKGAKSQVFEGSHQFPAAAELAASGESTVYELAVVGSWHGGKFDAEGKPIYVSHSKPVGVQLAFQGDHMLFGFEPFSTGESMIDFALESLNGGSRKTLTDNERFQRARGNHPSAVTQLFYMDFPNMFDSVLGFVEKGVLGQMGAQSGEAQMIREVVTEIADLVGVMESISAYSYIEDDVLLVSDTVIRYVDRPETLKNPIFLSGFGLRNDPGLIDAVPADATGFFTYAGLEVGPLHDWALDFIETRVPDGDKALAAYDLAQAAIGIDVRDELLPVLFSAVSFSTFPARQPTANHSEDMVFLARSSNPTAARSLWKRAARAISAGGAFVDDANRQLSLIARNLPEFVRFVVPSDLQVEKTNDPFPGMLRVSINMMGQRELLMGSVGDMWVASTAPEAISYVLETYAGEYPNITENEEFVTRSGMPDRPLYYATYSSYASLQKDMLDMVTAMQGAAGWLPAMLGAENGGKGGANGEPSARELAFSMALEVFPKVREIIEVVDFYDSALGWGFISEDGLTEVYRSVTVHKKPSER